VAETPAGLDVLVAARAGSSGERRFLWTPDEELTYREAHDRAERLAAGLQQRGIGAGDRVVLLMGNSVEQVVLWLAVNRVGAVSVPVNTALTGDLLARAVRTVTPALLVIDDALLPTAAAMVAELRVAGVPVHVNTPGSGLGALTAAGPAYRPDLDDLAPAVMLFTSGSTGVPKACVLSRRYVVRAGQLHAKYLRFTDDDVLFTPFPLFHIDAATLTVAAAAASGATAALSPRFSASRFWDEVRACGATVFNYMGATANILWKQPPGPADREHRVRLAWGVPMPACGTEWEARFGFPLVEVYGLTDAGVPCYQPLDEPRVEGSCGRVIPEYDLRIGDEAGEPLAPGQIGEIMVRSREPGLLMNEYFAMPEATASALRGDWFHTGDLGRLDERGNLFFCARGTEVIRRRGENIAASDVEHAVDAHPDVVESAAVGVPSELSEDDIKVFVVLRGGARLSAEGLVEYLRSTLPRYMVPRYVERVDELPKTPTEKVERVRLAARELTAATWDAEIRDHVRTSHRCERELSR
jgi:crotonobetaine/carnitine-CoA ligase